MTGKIDFLQFDRYKPLYVLFTFALIIKGSILAFSQVVGHDGPLYIMQAQLLLEGNWREAFAMPINQVAFPGLIALMSFAIPDLELAGRMVSFFASVFVVIPFYILIKENFDENSAFFGTAAFLVTPRINEYAVEVMRDSVFIIVFVSAVLFASRFLKNRHFKDLALFYLLSASSVLFRLEGFLLLVFFSLYFSCSFLSIQKLRSFKLKSFHLILVFTILVVAWLAYQNSLFLFKFFRLNDVYVRLFYSMNGDFSYINDIKAIIKGLKASSLHFAWDNDFFQIVANNIRTIYFIGLIKAFSSVLFFPFFIFISYALWINKPDNKTKTFLVLACAVYLIFSYLYLIRMNFIAYRYLFPAAVFLYPWLGLGIGGAMKYLGKFNGRKTVSAIFLGLFMAWPAYESFGHLEEQMFSGKVAGQWLGQQGELTEGKMILSNDGTIPFYAGQRWNPSLLLNDGSLDVTKAEDWSRIESIAMGKNAQVITLSLHRRKADVQPRFEHFSEVKSFADKRYRSMIFVRNG